MMRIKFDRTVVHSDAVHPLLKGLKDLRDYVQEIHKFKEKLPNYNGGLCLINPSVNSNVERVAVMKFLEYNKPFIVRAWFFNGYWWKKGKTTPRLKWLNKAIEKIEENYVK